MLNRSYKFILPIAVVFLFALFTIFLKLLSDRNELPAGHTPQAGIASRHNPSQPGHQKKTGSKSSTGQGRKKSLVDLILKKSGKSEFERGKSLVALTPDKLRPEIDADEEKDEDEVRASGAREAMKFRLLQMKDENGKIPVDGLLAAKQHMERMKAAREERRRSGELSTMEVNPNGAGVAPTSWVWLGPGNVGGRIRCILTDPSNANNLWAGSASGGIWRTTNAGGSWAPVDDFLPSLSVSSMVMDPTNSNVIYAGTGEQTSADLSSTEGENPSSDGIRGMGIFKSTDAGTTWNQLPSTNPADVTVCGGGGITCPWSYVNRITISPDGTTILAATVNGIRRSTDGGATWPVPFIFGTASRWLTALFNPVNSQLAIAAGYGAAVYSTNGGATWSTATFAPPLSGAPGDSLHVELAYAPSTAAQPQPWVYATIDQNGGVVYLSTDGGKNYSQVNYTIPGSPPGITLLDGGQGDYDNVVWVNPQDKNFLMVGGRFMFRSTDGGVTFTGVGYSLPRTTPHADHHAIVSDIGFNNTTNRMVYFGSDGGMFRWNDCGGDPTLNWDTLNNSLGITQFYGAAGNDQAESGAVNPFRIIGGTQDNGTVMIKIPFQPFISGWTEVSGGDGGFAAADPTDKNFVYGETPLLGSSIFRSTDGGTTKTNIYAGITDAPTSNFVAPFILDPNNPNTMYAGTVSLWRSTDVKNLAAIPSWTSVKGPIPAGLPVSAITVSPDNPNLVLVGYNNGEIWKATDATATPPTTWVKISNGTPTRYVTRLVIDKSRSPHWFYATFGGFSSGSPLPSNVYRSTDQGVTWTAINGSGFTGLPSVPVRSLVIHPLVPDFLYIGTEMGIFTSEDAGASWFIPQDGPANVAVDELFFLTHVIRLIAVTHGRGIYEAVGPLIPSCGGGFTACQGVPPSTGPFWDEPANWPQLSCQTPSRFDDVFISDGCNFEIRGFATCRNLTIAQNASLTIDQGANLHVYGDIKNKGTITGQGTISPEGATTHHLFGNGVWTFAELAFLNGNSGVLDSDLTMGVSHLAVGSAGFSSFTTLNINGHNLTFTGHSLTNSGIIDIGSGSLNLNGTALFSNIDTTGVGVGYGLKGTGTITFNATGTGELDYSNPSGASGNFQPSLDIGSGTVTANFSGEIDRTVGIDGGATLQLSGSMAIAGNFNVIGTFDGSSGASLSFNGPTLTNNGSINTGFMVLNTSGAPKTQTIKGFGAWTGSSMQIGNGVASISNTTLSNNAVFNTDQFIVSSGSTLAFNDVVTFLGSLLNEAGTLSGTGSFRMLPGGGSATLTSASGGTVSCEFRIVSGTVTANTNFGGTLTTAGQFTVDPGATFNGNINATGNVNVNGTLSNGTISFAGTTFTNNGAIASESVDFNPLGAMAQNLGGAGTWTGNSGRLFISSLSTTTLLNDVTFAEPTIFIIGTLNTGAFTLTLPCTVAWQGSGDVNGKVKRTNLAACAGPIAFGSPFTTISFNAGGTLPTDVTVTVIPGVPAGFPNAVARTYLITANGGSGWSATLRLHYLDSELNGNNESTLQLWRFNGSQWNTIGVTARDTVNDWVEFAGVTQFSPWAIGPAQVSSVKLETFKATAYDNGVSLEWQTGLEVDNLGFHIYREQAGLITRVTPELIAGSALVSGSINSANPARAYRWWDANGSKKGVHYWLEDTDLKGVTTRYGPIQPKNIRGQFREQNAAAVLSSLGVVQHSTTQLAGSAAVSPASSEIATDQTHDLQIRTAAQRQLASKAALKIGINEEGWYRITRPELLAAGLDSKSDPRNLQLYLRGVEQAMLVTGADRKTDHDYSIEFYAYGQDSPFTDQHIYWLINGDRPGKRIDIIKSAASPGVAASFTYTAEARQRTIYFSSLRNGPAENFFGPVVGAQSVDQRLTLQHLDQTTSSDALLEVALQGVTDLPGGVPDHVVTVTLNGSSLGSIIFDGQQHQVEQFRVPQRSLREGENIISLAAQGGPSDISLLDYVRLTYRHTYTADQNTLRAEAENSGGHRQTINGFTNSAIRVFDITNLDEPHELAGSVSQQAAASFSVSVSVSGSSAQTLLALTADRIKHPQSIALNQPTDWLGQSHNGDLLIITHRSFISSLAPLVKLRQQQGYAVEVVDVDDIFDEMNFGEKQPEAIKNFLSTIRSSWAKAPRYLLLVGDASFDPRNYLGAGNFDFVPTELIATDFLETASDDWFADFDDDGIPEMYVGRLPVRTPAEASTVVSKIVTYDAAISKRSTSPASVLLIADANDGFNFELESEQLRALLPGGTKVDEIFRGGPDDATAKKRLLDSINAGQSVVNYTGHGSADSWRSLFTTSDIGLLNNRDNLPLVIAMTCLNGYIQDPVTESLGKGLLKSERGGAIAVWASSGLTLPGQQALINQQLYRLIFASPETSRMTIGEATSRAKSATSDIDVRRTWLLLGDPTMRLK